MKKLFTGMMIAMIAFTISACDFFADPGAYNDQMVDYDIIAVEAFDDFEWAYLDAFDVEALNEVETLRQDTISIIGEQRDLTLAMEPFRGDSTMRDKFAWGHDEMIRILEEDYKRLIELEIDMYQSDADNTAEMDELTYSIQDQIIQTYEEVSEVQEEFADENGFELIYQGDY